MFIYLGATLVLGVMTPLINELSIYLISIVPAFSIVGVLIIAANFIIHYNIPRWNQTSLKSLLIYAVGVLLCMVGFLHLPEKMLGILQA